MKHRLLWALAFLLGLTSCSHDATGISPVTSASSAVVGKVQVEPATLVLTIGQTPTLSALLFDGAGTRVFQQLVTWSSSDPTVASVSTSGTVTALSVGTTTIRAASGSVDGAATVHVVPYQVVALTVEATSRYVLVGSALDLSAVVRDDAGRTILHAPANWSTSDSTVARVVDGRVSGLRHGSAQITASLGGFTASLQLTIFDPLAVDLGVQVGDRHACALLASGKAYCWGMNGMGQLGSQPSACFSNSQQLCALSPVAVSTSLTFSQVSAGSTHTCGLLRDGSAYCWGSNDYGELGNAVLPGTPAAATSWIAVTVASEQRFVSISAGDHFTCAVTVAREVFCWGKNHSGELGDGTNVDRSAPVRVTGSLQFANVSTSRWEGRACGTTLTGQVYCWGNNFEGGLGIGSRVNSSTPRAVANAIPFKAVSAGHGFSCGVATTGVAYCWGRNWLADTTSYLIASVPTVVAGTANLQTISVGSGSACGVASGGAVTCWGSGALGRPVPSDTIGTCYGEQCISRPGAVSGGLAFTSVSVGWQSACGHAADGKDYCWGWGYAGELGNGYPQPTSITPVVVSLPQQTAALQTATGVDKRPRGLRRGAAPARGP